MASVLQGPTKSVSEAGLPSDGASSIFAAASLAPGSSDGAAAAIADLAASRVRYDYRRLPVFLKREGWPVNAKRIWRLYSEEGL